MLKRASLALCHYPNACFRACNCCRCMQIYHVAKLNDDLKAVQKSNQDFRRALLKLRNELISQEGGLLIGKLLYFKLTITNIWRHNTHSFGFISHFKRVLYF